MSKRTHSLVKILLTLCFSICLVACIFSMNFASAATAPSIKDGASIRYDDKAGIRFSAYVPDEYFADTDEHVLNDGITVGMEISLSPFEESTDIKTVNPTAWKTKSDKKGHQQYNVVIYNIPETDYATSIYARAFISGAEIVEGEDTTYTATVVRSIREVANATLAGDLLVDSEDVDNKLTTNQIQALEGYVSEDADVLGDLTVKIRGGYAVWEAVENATTYLVKTESGTFKTTETKFLLDGDREVSVVAYGDGTTATYSNVSAVNRTEHTLTGNQIATFDDESYIEDLEAGNHTLGNWNYTTGSYVNENHTSTYSHSFYTGNGSAQKEADPTFADGIASFGLGVTSYNGVASLRTSVFSVYLQDGLDLTNYAGIKIKLMFEKFSADPTNGVGDLTFKLAHPTTTAEATGTRRQHGYVEPNTNNPYIGGSEISVTAGEWIEWYITNEELKAGDFYSEGDQKLVISFFTANTFTYTQTRTAYFQIDDISYFNIGAPANVALDGTTLSWDAVDGATSYVIDVDGNEYTTAETSYDLSETLIPYTSAIDVKVKAVNSESGEESSFAVVSYDIDTPTNVALSEAKVLTWDAVVNATGYVIDVNGEEYTTTENSYDLSSVLTSSTTIKVRAKRNALYSDYSESVDYDASSVSALMSFGDSSYETSVRLGKNAAISSIAADTTTDYTVEYQNAVDGTTDGALYALPTISRYVNAGGARLAIFTITLPEALSGLTDGTNDGISITLKFGDIVKTDGSATTKSNTAYTLMLIKNGYSITADNEYRRTGKIDTLPDKYAYTEVTVGEFYTWKISAETLSNLAYVDGVAQITFGVSIEIKSKDVSVTSGAYGYCIETWLDELAYYKEAPV